MVPQPPDSLVIVAILAFLVGILLPAILPREVMEWAIGGGFTVLAILLTVAMFRRNRSTRTKTG